MPNWRNTYPYSIVHFTLGTVDSEQVVEADECPGPHFVETTDPVTVKEDPDAPREDAPPARPSSQPSQPTTPATAQAPTGTTPASPPNASDPPAASTAQVTSSTEEN